MRETIVRCALVVVATAAIVASTSTVLLADSPSTAPATQPADAGPAKFYGPVTSVDTMANTFVVGDQTYKITAESQVTKDNKTATLADAVVGEPAHGSYTKAADGPLTITKVRFGKKAGGKSGGKKKKAAASQPDNG